MDRKKSEKVFSERAIELLKENGIKVSAEQAKQLLNCSHIPVKRAIPYEQGKVESQFIKGYRVVVRYDDLSEEEMKRKKNLVARIVCEAMKKNKK